MSGSATISTSETRLANVRVQTSAFGLVIPLIYGRARISGNLSWYGNFKAIPHTSTTETGGKGGGGVTQQNTTYTYEAAVIMTLGHGPINGVVSAWKGKERLNGASVAGKIRTLKHNATPPSGGVVTVPESSAYKAHVSCSSYYATYLDVNGFYVTGFQALTEGTDYTHVAGVYTFAAAWVGVAVEIQYQVQDSAATNSALGQLGLSLATGTLAQPVWSWLNTFNPAQALTYSGFAYLYGQSYSLDNSAQLPNHNFEVSTPWERADLGTVDAHPADVLEDLLRDPNRGVGWSPAGIGDLTHYRDYCTALGLFMSPVLDTQRQALDWMKSLLELTNSDIVYSGSKIRIVPLGDEDATGNGATFIADTVPKYDLTIDDFVTTSGRPRVRIIRNGNDDVRGLDGSDMPYNIVTLEIENRANGYAVEPVSQPDLAAIEEYGPRPMDTMKATPIKTVAVGARVARLILQRQQARRAQYDFTLWANRSLLEPLDLVTLTDADVGLDRLPVRLLKIDERDQHSFDVVAEDAPIGMASAPQYGAEAGSGFAHDYSVSPGSIETPVMFEAPVELTTSTGLEVFVAARGIDPNWGGCRVWVSLDGTTFKEAGRLDGGSRYGKITGPISGGNLPVLLKGGQLLSGTAGEAENLATLCFVGGSNKEFIAYETATLTGTNAYTLSGLVAAAYGTTSSVHATNDPFVRVDNAIARSGPLDLSLIGETIQFKFTSFNIYGGAEQSLADVSAYSYTITGSMAAIKPGFAGKAVKLRTSGLVFQYPKAGGVNPASITLTAERKGTLVGAVTFSVQAGTVTLAGSGDVRTIDPATFTTESAVIRASITDAVATFIDEVTIAKVREGNDGVNGLHNAIVYIYQRAASAPSLPSAATTYTFASGALTGLDNGWSTSIPTGSNPLYVSVATASSSASSDTIGAGEWASAVVLAQNGSNGSNGSNGTDGAAGANVASVYIYQRAASVPTLPSATATFTFATGGISGLNNGWTATIPDGTDPIYVSTATAFAAGSTDTIAAGEWAAAKVLAQNGANGSNGAPGAAGSNTAVVYIYQRATSAPTLPSATTTYTFASAALTGLNNGWSSTIPAGTNPLYASVATATSTGSSDTIAAGEWASPVVLAQNGADGSNGSNGSNGSPGTDGANVASVFIYKRDTSSPALPSATATYTFATGALTGLDNGWTATVPAGTDPIYVSTATAFSNGSTDTIASSEWAAVKILAQNGADSIASALSLYAFGLPADSTGLVSSYSGCVSTMTVQKGGVDDTSNWTFSRTNGSGVSSSIASNVVTVTSLSTGQDTGYVDVIATRSGFPTQTIRFALSKNKSATPASGPVNFAVTTDRATLSPTNCVAGIRLNVNGTVERWSGSAWVAHTNWYSPTTTGIGSSYDVVANLISGTTPGVGTLRTSQSLSGSPAWTITRSVNGTSESHLSFSIFDGSGNTVATGTADIYAERSS